MDQAQARTKILLVSSIAALAGLLFGFDTGIISGALLFIKHTFPVTTDMQEWIVGSVLIGAITGSFGSGRLTDRYGRRGIMLAIAALFIFGTFIAALAAEIQMILIGRFFIGMAIGIGSYAAPLYIAEAAPYEKRGGLITLNQLMITVGIFLSYCINYLFATIDGSWRLMFMIGLVPAILLGAGMLFLPESPRWLVMQNKLDKARETLRYLGLFIGTLQLTFMPDAGIWITGGVILKNPQIFDCSEFYDGIKSSPSYWEHRQEFPLGVLQNTDHAFIGGAYYAARLFPENSYGQI